MNLSIQFYYILLPVPFIPNLNESILNENIVDLITLGIHMLTFLSNEKGMFTNI